MMTYPYHENYLLLELRIIEENKISHTAYGGVHGCENTRKMFNKGRKSAGFACICNHFSYFNVLNYFIILEIRAYSRE